MTIDIQRKGGGGVAQIALYRLNIIPGPNRGHSIAVPEIVEAGIRAANGRGGLFKCPVNGWLCQMVSQLIREHKLVLLPQCPAMSRCLACSTFRRFRCSITKGATVIVRALLFFVATS